MIKLYIGNLSWGTTSEGLREMFSKAGQVVDTTVMVDKMTGKSRGYGFVEFGTTEEADAAITMFNGQEVDGRTLTVNIATPRDTLPVRGSFGDEGDDIGFQVLIDPGSASPEVIAEVFEAFSALNIAVGGEGLMFLDDPDRAKIISSATI